MPGHKCRNKRLYSLCIINDDGEDTGEVETEVEDQNLGTSTPRISINALEGTNGFHTLKVTGKVNKHSLFIMVDSGRTRNFLNTERGYDSTPYGGTTRFDKTFHN
jgi:hypothetical protein